MRTTIKTKVSLEGIGLHKGLPCRVDFLPAETPTGIRFLLPGAARPLEASLANIQSTQRGTNLAADGAVVYTVEHLLSAAAGLGIDDLDIRLSAPEPPAMDGSALPFAAALLEAGPLKKPEQEKTFISIKTPCEFKTGQSAYAVYPADAASLKVTYSHPHRLLGEQSAELGLSTGEFMREIAPARTFGFKHELDALKAAGLALGGSLDNALVVTDEEILAKGGLRFPNEPVRHKLLDLLGDLKLLGGELRNIRIEAFRSGHAANADFAKMLLARKI